ncbi:unnamed protein product [Rotaria sordida]|uniref:EF-hand domain-containing protein n=1 Tax=Rotaria sordida TaxID=392033 RepID=A0A813MF26_9BILA|nr:unnamed protein product [Rotaria sordida]CAF0804007.1 unnamed protein product [Rotaria sordida]CAF0895459.1 unnamed protein product [Rotaria sordida]CAF0908532.1 unnamed protein product [Rotaria sordida]CAF0909328.1 unnamed protein product [Rotaria sordida]
MGDKPRLSLASLTGVKGAAAAAQFKRLFNQPSISSLSNHEDIKEERIELENLLGTEDLEKLRLHGFSKDKVLDKEQFIEFLRNTLNRGSDQDYDELFECVDVTKEGFISWDKLATYLMLKLYDNDDREKASSVPNWKSGKSILNAHRDSVKRIQHMDSFSRYISISKEGTVCIYNDEMQLYKTFKAATESCKMRDLWITDFVFMANVNKVAIAYTSKELIIYDMTSKLELSLTYRIVGIDATSYCLDYWSDRENPNDAILSWGDVKGNVHAILFNSAIIALFERPPQQTNNAAYTRVQLEDIANGNYKNASYLTYNAHTEWTRQVKYADHLDCFISCSTNTKTALVFGWMDKSGLTVRVNYSVRIRQLREIRSVVEISQGLNSFDYSRNFNLIATAGVNYQVSLWNPFVLSKPNGILRGHMRSVLYVQFIPSRGQLLSFSKDKILRIWDVQLQICLQRLSNIFPRGPEEKKTIKAY